MKNRIALSSTKNKSVSTKNIFIRSSNLKETTNAATLLKKQNLCTAKELYPRLNACRLRVLVSNFTKSRVKEMIYLLIHPRSQLTRHLRIKPIQKSAKVSFRYTEELMMEWNREKRSFRKIKKQCPHNKWKDWSHCFHSRRFMMRSSETVRYGSKMIGTKINGKSSKNN